MNNTGKQIAVLFLAIFTSVNLLAQTDSIATAGNSSNPVSQKVVRNGSYSIMAQLVGPELFGIYGNYYFNRKVSLNAGLGLWTSMHLGANYYLLRKNYYGLYLGAQVCRIPNWNFDELFGYYAIQPGIFVPVGLELNSESGFIVGVEVGYNYVKDDYSQSNTMPVVFTLRIGGVRLR